MTSHYIPNSKDWHLILIKSKKGLCLQEISGLEVCLVHLSYAGMGNWDLSFQDSDVAMLLY